MTLPPSADLPSSERTISLRGLWQRRPIRWGLLAATLAALAALFVLLGQRIDLLQYGLGFDWWLLYDGLRGGRVEWGITRAGNGMILPPWAVIFVLPLGLFPYSTSYYLVFFLTIIAFLASIPLNQFKRPAGRIGAVVLTMFSYFALRNYADANVEFVTLFGIALMLMAIRQRRPYWLGIGTLMATIKPQTTYLLIIGLMVYLLRTSKPDYYLRAGVTTLGIFALTMIWGAKRWIAGMREFAFQSGQLSGTLVAMQYGIPIPVIVLFALALAGVSLLIVHRTKRLTHLTAGLLVTMSILLAPYSTGLNFTVAYNLGVIPLLTVWPVAGIAFAILFNLPFVMTVDPQINLIFLFLMWLVIAAALWQQSRADRPRQPDATQPA